MKRIPIIMLLVALSLSLFSCTATVNDEIAPNYETEYVKSYNGSEFVYLIDNDDLVLGYVDGTLFADLVTQRISDVEDKLDVKIELSRYSGNNSQLVQTETYAGICSCSAVLDATYNSFTSVRAGIFYDLATISEVDFLNTEKWGSIELNKNMYWDGGLYGIFPAYYPLLWINSVEGPLIVNEQYIKKLGQTDPREFVEKGTWTWDTFEDLMPVYAHTDDTGRYVYALYTTYHWLFKTIQTTNGEKPVYKDSNGAWKLGMYKDCQVEALQTGYNWAFGEYRDCVGITGSWESILPEFVDGVSVFAIFSGREVTGTKDAVAYQMDDFGVLPFPIGPNGSADNPGTTTTANILVTNIPALCQSPEMSAVVLDEIYDYLPGFESMDKCAEYLRQNYFFDDRDVNVYLDAYKKLLYNYRWEGLTDMYINIGDTKTLTEWLEKYREANETNLRDYVVNMEETIEQLYGTSN